MISVVFKIKVVYLLISKLEKDTTCEVWCSRLSIRSGQVDEIVASFSGLAADFASETRGTSGNINVFRRLDVKVEKTRP